MAEKNIKTRIIHKHDTEENWNKATNFIPRQGEIIVYDVDATHTYERLKIGDGVTNVNSLPFAAVEVLTVVVTQNDDDSFSADKTYNEIIEAINQHKVVQIADMNKNVVPLSRWENENVGFTMTYGYENNGVAGALRHYISSYEWVISSANEVYRRVYEVSNVTNEDIVSIVNNAINSAITTALNTEV